jgi:hypothetical protein
MGRTQSEAEPGPSAIQVTGRRFALASPATATALGVVVLVLMIAAETLIALDHELTIANTVSGPASALTFAVVGVVVARHQPRNPVGWILILVALLTTLTVGGGAYAVLGYRLGHLGLPLAPAAVLLGPLWLPGYALVALVFLLFPDGRLTSRRWRWVLWAYAVLVACVMGAVSAPAIAAVAAHDIHVDSAGNVTSSRHLAGWLAHLPVWVVAIVLLSIAMIWISFVAHQVLSWRQATGEHRQQLKWLASGAAVTIGLGLIGSLATTGIVQRILEVGIVALPVAIGVGILKYRLYEIDRIISRTVAYVIVTGLLVGIYAGVVLLATRVLPSASPVAVAGATLVAAALFNPLRRRVQRIVDRRFNRARYDIEVTVAAFAVHLKDAVDLDSIRDDLAGVVQKTLEPAHISVWLNQRD